MQILKLLFLTMMTIFITCTSLLNADNNAINGTCPGETIEEIDGVTTTTSYTENGGIGGGGNDRYQMNFPVAGTLSIVLTNTDASRNANYNFYLSNTTCGNWNLINGEYGNTHSTTINVNAGDTIWVKMQSIATEPNRGRHSYALALTFTPTATNTTTITTGAQPFILINPANTRNILGNYAITGNTVECITSNTGTEANPFNGTCQNGTGFNDNNNMAKYIDIDNNNSTWNSSSSNFTLPNDLDNNGTQGILWAGLFWQGAINNNQLSANNVQRRASLNNGIVTYTNINRTTAINIANTAANRVLLKVDTSSYSPVQANTMSIDNAFVSNGVNIGGFYGAYSDVTQLLQNQNLTSGNHTITIANLTANEGRQRSTGNYAGWSLVVIYKQKGATAKARNISIYNGYAPLSANSNNNFQANTLIQISGFKLPTDGPVDAQFSSFAGEGEFIYGNGTNAMGRQDFDRMVMKRLTTDAGDNMPGAIDSNNIFDARLANIQRTSGNNNALTGNNNGIDIDSYDVSTIMENYRALDPKLNTVYVGISTNHDYIVPSMIAFSAELYQPKVCYDYTLQQNNYDITADGNSTAIHTIGDGNLAINIALQSQEGDFDFQNSQISVSLSSNDGIHFDSAYYAPNLANTLIPATFISPFSNIKPNIAIGEQVTASGGIIRKRQRYFSQFNYNLESAIYNGFFDVDFNSTINFGSGAVPVVASTKDNTLDRCPQSPYYRPISGTYNIERHNSVGNPNQKYPLYTQVVGKDFDFDLVAYSENNNYNEELDLDHYTVDIELINAKPYNDLNSTFVCTNPDPSIIQKLDDTGKTNYFAQFNGTSRVDLSGVDIQTDTALRNATFRMWYLVDRNNTLIDHNCTSDQTINEGCFQDLYNTYFKDTDTALRADGTHGFCSAEQGGCTNYYNAKTDKGGCYACLRDFFSKALCARDNFAIRPASYRLTLSDTNETDGSQLTPNLLVTNNTVQVTNVLAAGYKYKLQGRTASYIQGRTALGYTRKFTTPSSNELTSTLINTNQSPCIDLNNSDWGINFLNGQIQGTYSGTDLNLSSGDLVKHSNVGTYEYYLHDINWTKVDQSSYPFKTFPDVDDCVIGENIISVGPTEMVGCNTDSNLTDTDQGIYTNLKLSFMPYRFDLTEVNLRRLPTDGQSYVYMNDFSNAFYPGNNRLNPQYSMSMAFSGRVKAYAKDGKITSNFEYACRDELNMPIAKDVNVSVEKSFDPQGASDNTGAILQFQEFLQDDRYNLSNANKVEYLINQADINDSKTTILDTWFRDSVNINVNANPNVDKGSAYMRLDTNIKKPTGSSDMAANPVRIFYHKLKVSSPDARSSANMTINSHIPKGEKDTNDRNITSYFSKIVPARSVYDPVFVGDTVNATLLVDIYCDNIGINCGNFGLTTPSKSEEDVLNWFSANFYAPNDDGQVDLNAITAGVNNIGINPNQNIRLPLGTANINVNGFAANVPVTIFIHPQEPWHFSPGNGIPRDPGNGQAGDDYPEFFRIFPIGQAGWSGVGTTGNTAGTTSSGSTPRMNW